MALLIIVLEREELGPEVNLKMAVQSTPVPYGDHLAPSQILDITKLQVEFSNMFLPLPSLTILIEHHIETTSGVVVRSHPYWLPEDKKNAKHVSTQGVPQ